MPTLRRVWQTIIAFRLEYAVSRPYPWRWFTPAALAGMLLLTILFTLINIPLAAYDRVTEVTYFPNETNHANPFWSFIPSLLKKDTDDELFVPQIISVGDKLSPNGSVYSYKVEDVHAGQSNASVSSFAFFNHDLADSCDVAELRYGWRAAWEFNRWTQAWQVPTISDFGIKVTVECWIPVNYTLTFDTRNSPRTGNNMQDIWQRNVPQLEGSLRKMLWSAVENGLQQWGGETFDEVVVVPSCECNLKEPSPDECDPWRRPRLKARPPCGSEPAQLSIISRTNDDTSVLLEIMLALYYGIRLDLGIAEPNVASYYTQRLRVLKDDSYYLAFISQWRQQLDDLICTATRHTPTLSYSRAVWRRKPMGSAILSVYTSTFTMVSLVWTIFSLTAAFIANARDDSHKTCAGCNDLEMSVQPLEVGGRQASPSTLPADASELNAYLD